MRPNVLSAPRAEQRCTPCPSLELSGGRGHNQGRPSLSPPLSCILNELSNF